LTLFFDGDKLLRATSDFPPQAGSDANKSAASQ
jgi:hypothetical protein